MAELKNDKMANDKVRFYINNMPEIALLIALSFFQLTEGIQGFEKDGAALKEMLKEKLQQ